MDPRDVRKGFNDAVRSITKHAHVQEEIPEETDEQKERAYERKYFTYVIASGPRYIGRRKR